MVIVYIFDVLQFILTLIRYCLIATAILSWLIYFNVINTRSQIVVKVIDLLDRVTAPILEPFRRVIPNIGGFDISFIVAYMVIVIIQQYLLPIAAQNLLRLMS